jgi:hypothetical protein
MLGLISSAKCVGLPAWAAQPKKSGRRLLIQSETVHIDMMYVHIQRGKKMTTKIKLTLVEVVLVIILAVGMLTAVQANRSGVASGGIYLPDVAGEACSTSCNGG